MKNKTLVLILLCIQIGLYAQKPDEYEVYAIRFGTEKDRVPLSFAAAGASDKDSISFCDMFWLLVGNGKHILVDAGYPLNEFNKEWCSTYIRPDSALLRIGIRAADITDIIITHPHDDHIAGVVLFPAARIWMQKDDYDDFVGSAWQKNGFSEGFYKEDVKMIVAKCSHLFFISPAHGQCSNAIDIICMIVVFVVTVLILHI